MHWPARRLTRVALMTSALLGASVAVPAVAYADPPAPCYGSSCVGVDPAYANVSGSCGGGATTLASVSPPGGGPSVELRWSDWCHANWARLSDPEPGPWNYWVETWDRNREYAISYDSDAWTYMVDGDQLARACIQGYATTQYSCTGWH